MKILYQVAIHAHDLNEAVTFYSDVLGAEFIAKFDPPGLVFFNFSGVRLLLEQAAPQSVIYVRVEDIAAAVTDLQAKGVSFEQLPETVFKDESGVFGPAGETETMAFLKDPSGNTIGLVERR